MLKRINYLWHSVVAPNYSVTLDGVVIQLPDITELREIQATEAADILARSHPNRLLDRVHQGLLRVRQNSPCQIADMAEEGGLLSLSMLIKKGQIRKNQDLLVVSFDRGARRGVTGVFFENTVGFKSKAQQCTQKAEKYDKKHPLWAMQRQYFPSSTVKQILS